MTAGAGQHVAERLYYDSWELRFEATVTDVRLLATTDAQGEKVQLWQVALDRTAFYPESGGQPWDTGVLIATSRSGAVLSVAVEQVTEDAEGEVWHVVRKPLVQGTAVEGRVDAGRRIDHMQQHSGQHLLSAVFWKQAGARTVSFHLGPVSSTIDLEFAPGVPELGEQDVEEIEREANRLIFEDRSLSPQWVSREAAEAMLARGELRKLPDRSGPMRIVEMQGVEWNACGGTHVRSTGAIGGLQIRGRERARGAVRVEFVCGMRAVALARQEYLQSRRVAELLSTSPSAIADRVSALLAESKSAGKRQLLLQGELARLLANGILQGNSSGTVAELLEGREPGLGRQVASELAKLGRAAVVGSRVMGEGAVTLALPVGETRRAGELMQKALAIVEGRGGGGPTLAQATCVAENVEELMAGLQSLLAG